MLHKKLYKITTFVQKTQNTKNHSIKLVIFIKSFFLNKSQSSKSKFLKYNFSKDGVLMENVLPYAFQKRVMN